MSGKDSGATGSASAHSAHSAHSAYREAGVDIDAGHRAVDLMKAAVEATHGPEVLAGIGAFGGLFDVMSFKELSAPTLVASMDGVGTKTKLATALGRHRSLGHDIVNHCLDDILVQGARPLLFLDYVASSRLEAETTAEIVRGCAEACRAVGCALLGGETAEMPGVYEPGELDLVGTIVGVVDREAIIDGETIAPGDAIIGLASSGLHTNGYTLARHVVAGLALEEPLEELGGATLGDALLAPHRAYVAELNALRAAGVTVKALAHITGGGLIDNPPRIFPENVGARIRRGTWAELPVFGMLQRLGGIDDAEMMRVFNMGLGMLVFVGAAESDAALAALGDDAWRVGTMVARGNELPVVIES